MPNPTRRDVILGELTSTTDGFLAAIADVEPPQWSFKPSPERWSIAETAEHVTVVLRGIHKLVSTTLLSQPLPPRESSPRMTDDLIIRMMFDRSKPRPAPDAVLPRGRWATRAEVEQVFRESRDGIATWLDGVTVDLREYGAKHLVMGTLDGVQWLLFAAAHTERHTRQILDLKNSPGAS